ncbi:MAG: hypothetical protein QM655_05075 [Nocardioidaceae bacterium]
MSETPSEPELTAPIPESAEPAEAVATSTPTRTMPLWSWIAGGVLLWLVSMLLTATITSALTVHQVKKELQGRSTQFGNRMDDQLPGGPGGRPGDTGGQERGGSGGPGSGGPGSGSTNGPTPTSPSPSASPGKNTQQG